MKEVLYEVQSKEDIIKRLREPHAWDSNKPEDLIYGILVGFAEVLKSRDGHIDILTIRRAKNEIMEHLLGVEESVSD